MKSFEDKLERYARLSLKVTKIVANEKKLIRGMLTILMIVVIICVSKAIGKHTKSIMHVDVKAKLELGKQSE